jgi:hypothetical protein
MLITMIQQAFLAIAHNTGVLMAWAYLTEEVPANAIIAYIGGCFWTMWYGASSTGRAATRGTRRDEVLTPRCR